ncbi:uncharacterized protein LOC133334097 [Musca vetustissima]|uniref:uncharacterized protein LOC133334097 n=1 Tax=Musca vetustissima TaxID=27455 RepID=UPI002AB693C9|nr:uncharacterized protein LOC133334097 [Musca vetustissima]
MPGDNSGQSFSSSSVGETSGIATGGTANKSVAPNAAENTRSHRDSFCDFLDFHANRGQEKMSPRFVPRRDSFDWEALSRKPTSDESRLSLIGKIGGIAASGLPNISITPSDSFDARVNTSDFLKAPLRDQSKSPISPLAGKLSQIKEEEKGNQESSSHESSVEGESDKENPQTDLQFMPQSRLKALPANFNSTPNRNSMDGILTASNRPLLTSTVGPANRKQATTPLSINDSMSVQQAVNDLRNEMLERFKIEEIRDCLGVLLQTDPFVNEFLRLKEENEMLKLQLLQQSNRNE